MKYFILSSLVLATFLVSLPALADTFVRTGNQFELATDQIITGNFLGVGNPVTIAGEITQDATIVGDRVTVTGTVGGDVLGLGIYARLNGVVQGDARIVSGNTTISGTVAGDLLLVGGSVTILSDAVIEGDVVLFTGTAIVNGAVGGDILGNAQNITVNGPIGGGIDIHTNQLALGPNAAIAESVRYVSDTLLTQSLDTTIAGTVSRNDPIMPASGFSLTAALYPVLVLLFSTLLWLTLSKRTLQQLVQQTLNVAPRSAITGVVSFFVAPLIVFVLSVGLFGGYLWASGATTASSNFVLVMAAVPVLVVLFGYLTLFLLAVIAVPALLGQLCMYATKNMSKEVTVVSVLLGSAVCVLLLLLPAIGLFVFLFTAIIALGGLLEGVIKASR